MSRFRQLFPQATAIIFDLGGVVFNVDYQRTQCAFEELGLHNFSDLYSQAKQTGLFNDLETGKIEPAEFRAAIRRLAPACLLSDAQIDAAWNAMLIDLPVANLSLLTTLKREYRTFLLSNTNVIHLAALSDYLVQNFNHSSLSPYFEKDYYSSVIGYRKPDAMSYEFVMHANNLHPHTTVFIDDLPQNIEGATRTGLLTYHLTGGETITALFRDYNSE